MKTTYGKKIISYSKKIRFIIILIFFFLFHSLLFAQFSLWGVTAQGGINNYGVIFKYAPSTNTFTKIFDFDIPVWSTLWGGYIYDTTGNCPDGSFYLANNGKIYGLTYGGGSCGGQQFGGNGVLFEYDLASQHYSPLIVFGGIGSPCNSEGLGFESSTSPILASDGNLYGTQTRGSGCSGGCIFKFNIDSTTYNPVANFLCGTNSGHACNNLYEASDGNIYAPTDGWPPLHGSVIKYNLLTTSFTYIPYSASYYGLGGIGGFVEGDSGKLYAVGSIYGSHGYGTIFEYDYINNSFSKKWDFDSINDGGHPYSTLLKASNGYYYGMTSMGGAYNDGTIFRFDASTDTLIKLFDFDGTNSGANSWGSLKQASNGKIYGLTRQGGTYNVGVLFEFDPATNIFTKKFDFDTINGSSPQFTYLIEVPDSLLTGMANISKNINFNINPIPAVDNITIEYSAPAKNAEILIYNLQGQLILSQPLRQEKTTVDISTLAQGMYFVKLETEKGVAVKKIIKE